MQGCLCLPAWLLAVDNYRTTCGSCLELGPAFFFVYEASRIREWACTCKLLAFAIFKNAVEGDDVTSTSMYIFFWILNALLVYTNCRLGWLNHWYGNTASDEG